MPIGFSAVLALEVHMNFRTATLSAFVLTALALPTFAQAVTPAAGDLAISEMMFDPGPLACVNDANGEYFEVTNISTKVLDLNGLFFEDGVTAGGTGSTSGVFFRTTATVATIPPLYPGQAVVFVRGGNSSFSTPVSPTYNGGVANAVYVYTSATANADNSTVASSAMNFNNTGFGDGLHISVGGPLTLPTPNPNGYVLGTEIEGVSYSPSTLPYPPTTAKAWERKDLFAPMVVDALGNNSSNLALSTNAFVTWLPNSCDGISTPTGSFQVFGTPGAPNSTDVSLWPTNSTFDSASFPNTGVMIPVGPLSVGAGVAHYTCSGGPPFTTLFFGFAPNVAFELPVSAFFPGNPGAFLLDLASAQYLPIANFDANGAASLAVPVPNNPAIIGATVRLQWLSLDNVVFLI